MHEKSQFTQFILAFFFGLIGLLYSSVKGAVFLILLAIGLSFMGGFPALLTWPVSIIAGFMTVNKHNSKVRHAEKEKKDREDLETRRHRELLQVVAASGKEKKTSSKDLEAVIADFEGRHKVENS